MLNDNELQLLDGVFQKPNLDESLDIASRGNPEIAAESSNYPISPDVYQRNKAEIDRRKLLTDLNPEEFKKKNPKTSEWLSNPKNSSIAIDDLDILKGMEESLKEPDRGFWNNAARGGLNTVNKITGDFIEFLGNVSEDFDDYVVNNLGLPNPGIVFGDDGVSWSWDMDPKIPSAITYAGKAISEGEAYDYRPDFTWEKLKGDITPTNLAGYVVEQGVSSLPHMLAALYTLPAYITSRTESIAEERVTNDEREDVTGKDLAVSVVPAVAVALMERLGAKATFDLGKVPGVKEFTQAVGVAAATEGATEFVQEGIEYAGETLGTKKKFSAMEMLDRQFAGLVAGAGMGGTIRASTATVEAVSNRTNAQIIADAQSESEQEVIENIISYAQSSKTRERSPAQFEEFINTVGEGREVLIPNEVAIEIENAPDYIVSQINDKGTSVGIPIAKFAADIASNEAIMNVIRPHIKLSENTSSQSELESRERGEIQALLEKVKQEKVILTESDKIFESVKDQIIATGMQGEETARHSAAIYPAAAAVYTEKARKLGHEVGIEDIYDMMGFNVVRDAAKPRKVEIPEGLEVEMDVETIETGEVVQEFFNAQELDQEITAKQDSYKRLLDCLG